jgi:hypothetical protein
MKEFFVYYALFLCLHLTAKQTTTELARDGFLRIASDARAAGQGDLGVATSPDSFSQLWNPAKYVFSNKRMELGLTQFYANNREITEFSQISILFYNKLDDRSAYAIGIRNYANSLNSIVSFGNPVRTNEAEISGSYAMKLSNEFSMSVGGRFISLKGKVPLLDGFNNDARSSLYGIDVSGFYYGKELAYKPFNARWRAGFNFSNVRGTPVNDTKAIEIYAPSILKLGLGIDLIFNQDKQLAITSEYKTLLDSYTENESGEQLQYRLEGSVIGTGLEFGYKEKLLIRTGYSIGLNRQTDTFVSTGLGFKSKFANLDVSILLGVSEEENAARRALRLSLELNLEEVFNN